MKLEPTMMAWIYVGIDVSEREVKYLQTVYPDNGSKLDNDTKEDGGYEDALPELHTRRGTFDVIHLQSAFSHMEMNEI